MIWTVQKCTPSSRNPFFYNINKVEQGVAEIVAIRNFSDEKFGTLLRTLLERDAMAIRTEKPSVHMALSGDKNEKLTDAQAVELIDKNLKDVGFDKQPYIIIRHDDTDYVHYHVVSTKVCDDGKSVVWNGIGKRLVHSLSKYQKQYGYVASQDLHRKKEMERMKAGYIKDTIEQFENAYTNAVAYDDVKDKLECCGVKMKAFRCRYTGKPMIRLSRKGKRPVFVSAGLTGKMMETIPQNQKILDELRTKYPFQDPTHIMYIIHSQTDASIFHDSDEHKQFRESNISGAKYEENMIEAVRRMLKEKGYTVVSEQGPDGEVGFYKQLLAASNSEAFRLGSMFIEPDGKIVFREEKVFGDAEKTAPAFRQESELNHAAVIQKKVKEQQPAPATKTDYEIIKKLNKGVNKSHIIKRADGTLELQQYDWDKSITKNGKYTKKKWYSKAIFTSYSIKGEDNNYYYLEIQDVSGKTRYINQYGKDIHPAMLKGLGKTTK